MRRTLMLISIPVCALVALSGCGLASRGPVVSEERSIDAATSVVLDSWGDLSIREGEPSLVIRAPADVLKRLTAEVNDGELVLGITPGSPMISGARVEYELTLPSLEGIELNGSGNVDSVVPGNDLTVDISGSGDVDVDSIDASSVTVDVGGSGDVTLDGRADELTVSIGGSGAIRAESLGVAEATVDISGSGNVAVLASDRLKVSISGAGSVTYAGSPEIVQDISGSGDISRLG